MYSPLNSYAYIHWILDFKCIYYYYLVNKHFELLEFVFDFVYIDLQYDEISITFAAGSVSLCGVCSHVVVFGLSVRLAWYPMWIRCLLRQWCVYCCLCYMCVC